VRGVPRRRFYWQVWVVTLQMPEQQSASAVQKPPDGPQQLQVPPGTGPFSRHWELVPSGRRHGTALQVVPPWLQGSHGAGQWIGSQNVPEGQGWLVEHGRFEQDPLSLQNPHEHWPVASQVEFGAVVQLDGHGPLVLKQGGVTPGHWQHTGGVTQPHVPSASFSHWVPGGMVGGQGPVQPTSGSMWQPSVVVVVLVVVVVVIWIEVLVVVVGCPTTTLSTGAQSRRGGPTGSGPSLPNWSRSRTWIVFGKAAIVEHAASTQVFDLIL
jgi:hypothetical protein